MLLWQSRLINTSQRSLLPGTEDILILLLNQSPSLLPNTQPKPWNYYLLNMRPESSAVVIPFHLWAKNTALWRIPARLNQVMLLRLLIASIAPFRLFLKMKPGRWLNSKGENLFHPDQSSPLKSYRKGYRKLGKKAARLLHSENLTSFWRKYHRMYWGDRLAEELGPL